MATNKTTRTGFTLVEVLVVILIITILIALLVPALGYAVRRAENFGYVSDLAALEQALEAYRMKYNDYPPDFSDAYDGSGKPWQQTVVYRHIRDAFPRIHPTELQAIHSMSYALPPNDPTRLDAAKALVFWLGGLSNNPRYPFTGEGGPLSSTERQNALMDFKQDRLDFSQNLPVYLPGRTKSSPYVYFDARTYLLAMYPSHVDLASAGGLALPYFGRTNQFANPQTYQLICAGSDDIYALSTPQVYTRFPTGFPVVLNADGSVDGDFTPDPSVNYLDGQQDNLANFSEGQTLGDAQLQ